MVLTTSIDIGLLDGILKLNSIPEFADKGKTKVVEMGGHLIGRGMGGLTTLVRLDPATWDHPSAM